MFHAPARTRRRLPLTGVVTALALTLAAAGCADPKESEHAGGNPAASQPGSTPVTAAKPTANPAVVALVPQKYRSKGELVLATNAPYPPLEFFEDDNKTLTGFDIDLGNAIAVTMGLKPQWQNTGFDAIIPGLQAGKYDVGMTGFSIERERLEVMDFVSYYLSGGGFMIKKGSGIEVNSFDQLCGYRVAVQKGVSQVESLTEASKACGAKGAKPIDILQIPDQNVVVLTLASGRADVVVGDKPQVEYAASRSDGKMCVIGTYQTGHSIAGIAVPKGNPQLLAALQAAIDSLIKSGDYAKIAARWGTGVADPGATLSEDYGKVSAPWGVGPDGTIIHAKTFTDPNEIQPGHTYYNQPIKKGCA
ncbi:ABC transporter substrate-binding protein [Embleya scabrispora]|uniref:ABC transporter substrate-binding protein n=1 Tax=Embleya scabrispora TaxID=159449 RepID=UPI00036D6C1D|nr:ABC transporter substrate-binding protein [Embleya scabrispora]MYS84611.1 transporter substrate-binding domain-containing protein [Streptomyces sp. SID5474]